MTTATGAWVRALGAVGAMHKDPALTLGAMLDGLCATYGDRPALLTAGRVRNGVSFSYAELGQRVNQVARWALAHCAGETVGLLMPNTPDFVAIWLGLTRAGCVAALLNPQLTGLVLQHAVSAAGCRVVIAADDLAASVPAPVVVGHTALRRSLEAYASAPLDRAGPARSDTALLVFTSGTTGLPKAARVSHGRVLEWGLWFAGMMDLGVEDRIYDCLPLHHSTGGLVAIAAALVRGASVLIAPGFSASRFWDEVAEGGCTVFFYIGELCRYLLQSPPHAAERRHRLRLACGNGLHGSVWERFQSRFGLPNILEFYAATEGSISLYNCDGRPGSIGRVPPFLQARFPLALIAVDPETGEPVRDADGRCRASPVGEPGEAIGRVDPDDAAPARRFDGYTDSAATARKLLSDVFAPGDRWFRSGDLMRRDAGGYYYFVDRMGDTFRWKGENVSTTEVAAIVRSCPGVADAVVYGVIVPGHEGRAGMAAVVPGDGFDVGTLRAHLASALPAYAQPVFLRLCASLDRTATFKLSAHALARAGFADIADPVWLHDRACGAYVRCEKSAVQAIIAGTVRI